MEKELLDYFITHAPEKPQWYIDVPMDTERPKQIINRNGHIPMVSNSREIGKWNRERSDKVAKIWPCEWAKEQLKQRQKHI